MDNQQNNSTPSKNMQETVFGRALDRAAHVLTKKDIKELELFKTDGLDREKIQAFLLSRVPRFAEIIVEEIEIFKQEQMK